jgi:hypothetical protein
MQSNWSGSRRGFCVESRDACAMARWGSHCLLSPSRRATAPSPATRYIQRVGAERVLTALDKLTAPTSITIAAE